ncbi:MAG: CoA-binding protein [Gammaproteobacteria bacterium]
MIDSAAELRRMLGECRTVAIVGLSAKWHRPSYFAASYLLSHGYEIYPVNPSYSEILGRKCYPDLASAPRADVADCFRRAEEMPALAQQAAAAGARVFWMQLGVCNAEAAAIAEESGMQVVGDRCMKIEHARLFGGLNFAGVNTGVISPRRRAV